MPHQKSSDYKETAVIYEFSYKMGVLNEKRCKRLPLWIGSSSHL